MIVGLCAFTVWSASHLGQAQPVAPASQHRQANSKSARVGDSLTIGPGSSWPCSPEQSQVQMLKRWHDRMMDDNAPDSVMNGLADALYKTRSAMVGTKDTITILGRGDRAYRVRVTPYRAPAGRGGYWKSALTGCWISSDALNQ